MNSREFIILHHTDDPTQGPQFNKVNTYHKALGFPKSSLGFYVGYHYFIGCDGTVKVARAEWETGAHCNAMLMNFRGIGIALAGALHLQPPNELQLFAATTLVQDIMQRNTIPKERVLNHRDCKQTTCPGMDLAATILFRTQQITAEHLRSKMESYERVYATATDPTKQKMAARIIKRIAQLISPK